MVSISKEFFQTTHHRGEEYRTTPILCENKGKIDWLGKAFYFWRDIEFAHRWGKRYDYYDIYLGLIESSKVLDTVFNEDDYSTWEELVDSFIKAYEPRPDEQLEIKHISEFITDYALKGDIEVIIFQDLPSKNTLGTIKGFFYKKRVQVGVYNLNAVKRFEPIFKKVKGK